MKTEDQDKVTLLAVGDICPRRDNPESIFAHAAPILRTADIRFGQLEPSLSERGTVQLVNYPGLRVHPNNAAALTCAGFTVMSWASNHTMDWSDDAFVDTLDLLKKNNIEVIGAGKNIEQARRPAIIECKGVKVGFLAYCSVVPRGYDARADKSGVAPVRATTFYEQFDWQPGTPPRIISQANPGDLRAMIDDIKKLRPSVDVLVVSMHWGVHFVPSVIAMYQHEVGEAAVDAGADIVIGHGPHILKGIKVYKGKAIFFSLCNFAFDFPTERAAKNAFRVQYSSIGQGWEIDPAYAAYAFAPASRKSIAAKCLIFEKRLERVSFLPVMINQQAQPQFLARQDQRSSEVFEYMDWLCKDQKLDTKLYFDGDEIVVST